MTYGHGSQPRLYAHVDRGAKRKYAWALSKLYNDSNGVACAPDKRMKLIRLHFC
jgi:hypothetical protein